MEQPTSGEMYVTVKRVKEKKAVEMEITRGEDYKFGSKAHEGVPCFCKLLKESLLLPREEL